MYLEKKLTKALKVFFSVVVIMLIFSGAVSALEEKLPEVYVITDGNSKMYQTSKKTVEEFLSDKRIQVRKEDYISVALDEPIVDRMTIKIEKATPIELNIDGVTQTYYTREKLVRYFVDSFNKETGINHSYSLIHYPNEIIPNYYLELTSNKTETYAETIAVAKETEYVLSHDLSEGTEKIISEGRDGVRTIVTEIKYSNGQQIAKEVISDEITMEPLKRVIAVGADIAVSSGGQGENKILEILTMKATAYTSNFKSTGKNPGDKYFGITATGMKAQVGVVAVDPKVIPLHTKLYIVGYGYAVAGDTGGAIKGNRIDLYYDTEAECMNFGIQQIEVYVLE